MRHSARKTLNHTLTSREQLTIEHLRADPLRKLFPEIQQLRIELSFSDSKSHWPNRRRSYTRFCSCERSRNGGTAGTSFDATADVFASALSVPWNWRRLRGSSLI